MSDQLDLLRYAAILETTDSVSEALSGLPERLYRHCRWQMLLHAGRWWLGGALEDGYEGAAQLRWVPPGAGVVAADRTGAIELARLYARREGSSIRIYRPDGAVAFTLLVPRAGSALLAGGRARVRPLSPR